ncbi:MULTISPECIES: acetolactate synthase catalytic subunit [unclassified Mesorhizobium]|uniref:acetolactate synthase catalytic subunit n=1 Tax=unclassified Mesorhizobium TaxID=325217 RepID=UPI000FD87E2F|nr:MULTISPECIES: acetolactate synthase catalytic subunit [unclassified Mesorhizobium]TGT71839.1 acetolactate synthase catalytic subunit [Mesorhizobium sp. M2E.F.Ca.ET.166.01.1.1]TGV99447.1 acetolactate synthase catalytic subunit [Mesorhizobium sp. M2E.F.Ca.ET.154.01.1.1]
MSADETVATRVAQALKRHGVELIFAQSLPSAVILAAEAVGIRQIAYRQENMGGAMADGYARRSGRISVVAAQNGPAATLLVPPLAEALKASVPIVALVQEVERPQFDRNAFQELDHIGLFQPCAKWVRRVITSERVDDYVDAAFTVAGSGRPGPAVLLLPADLLREHAPKSLYPRLATLGSWPIDRSRPGDAAITMAAELLAEARQPVVMAGGGALTTGAPQALARLQETAHLPVVTTAMGKGAVSETHPLSLGVLGPLTGPGSLGRYSRQFLEEADVILLVGTRTNQNGTDSWRALPRTARIIHLDVDPGEIGRNYEVALRLVGDAAETLNVLEEVLTRRDLSQRQAGREELEQRIARARAAFEADRGRILARKAPPLRPERVMLKLQSCLTPEITVVADASYSSMWVVGQLTALKAGQRFLTPRGLAGLGWGLPMAIGAKLAEPHAPVVALVGDGGFAHSWAELETMVRLGIGVTVIVLNNGVLGYQKDAETVKFGHYTSACHFAPVDHTAIARACGCNAMKIERIEDVLPALRGALSSDAPWLIDVATDADAHPPLSLFDGTLDRSEPSLLAKEEV